MNYLSTDEDREIAGKSIKIVRKVVLDQRHLKIMHLKNIDQGYNLKIMNLWQKKQVNLQTLFSSSKYMQNG